MRPALDDESVELSSSNSIAVRGSVSETSPWVILAEVSE
jgi:hypothetical protein